MPLNAQGVDPVFFRKISFSNIYNEVKRLKVRKAAHSTDILVKGIRENVDIFSAYIYDYINKTIRSGKVPSNLKKFDNTVVFKDFKGSKENYRPVNILSIISKSYELYGSITIKIPMRALKSFSVHNCLLAM